MSSPLLPMAYMTEDLRHLIFADKLQSAGWSPESLIPLVDARRFERVVADAKIGHVVWKYIDRMEDFEEDDAADRVMEAGLGAILEGIVEGSEEELLLRRAWDRARVAMLAAKSQTNRDTAGKILQQFTEALREPLSEATQSARATRKNASPDRSAELNEKALVQAEAMELGIRQQAPFAYYIEQFEEPELGEESPVFREAFFHWGEASHAATKLGVQYYPLFRTAQAVGEPALYQYCFDEPEEDWKPKLPPQWEAVSKDKYEEICAYIAAGYRYRVRRLYDLQDPTPSNDYLAGLIAAQRLCDRIAGNSRSFSDQFRNGAGECSAAIRGVIQRRPEEHRESHGSMLNALTEFEMLRDKRLQKAGQPLVRPTVQESFEAGWYAGQNRNRKR